MNLFDGREQVGGDRGLHHIPSCPHFKSLSNHLTSLMLAENNDPGLGKRALDLSRGLQTAHFGHADIHDYDSRAQALFSTPSRPSMASPQNVSDGSVASTDRMPFLMNS